MKQNVFAFEKVVMTAALLLSSSQSRKSTDWSTEPSERYCNLLPAFGFNFAKYDVNLTLFATYTYQPRKYWSSAY